MRSETSSKDLCYTFIHRVSCARTVGIALHESMVYLGMVRWAWRQSSHEPYFAPITAKNC